MLEIISGTDRNFMVLVAILLFLVFIVIRFRNWNEVKKIKAAIWNLKRTTNIVQTAKVVNEAIITIDNEGVIVYSNDKTKKLFGWSEEDLIGENVSRIIPQEYIQKFIDFRESHSDGETFLEIEVIKRNGHNFHAEINIAKWEDIDEKIVFYPVAIRDISHRIANENTRKYAQSEIDRLRKLTVNGELLLHTGSWSWNIVEDIVDCSLGFRRIFGTNEEVIKAVDLMQYVYVKDRLIVNEAILSANETRKGYTIVYRVPQKNGTLDLVKCVSATEVNARGTLIVLSGAILVIDKNVNGE